MFCFVFVCGLIIRVHRCHACRPEGGGGGGGGGAGVDHSFSLAEDTNQKCRGRAEHRLEV